MPTYQGQTDQVLKIKLPSAILGARWGANEVATGGRIMLEVTTQWVADGSEIEIRVKDLEGGAIETLQGKVFGGIHRRQYLVAKANKTGWMYFEAELKAHKLKAVGPKVRVGPQITIKDLKWTDDSGNSKTELNRGETVTLSARLQGPQEGTKVGYSISSKADGKPPVLYRTFETELRDGKAMISWQASFPGKTELLLMQKDLEKHGLKYEQPSLLFEVNCLGVKAMSPEIKWIDWLEFDFGPNPKGAQSRKAKFEMPDGSQREEPVPENGIVKLPKAMPGRVHFNGFLEN